MFSSSVASFFSYTAVACSLFATTSTVSFPMLVILLKVAGFACDAEIGCSRYAE